MTAADALARFKIPPELVESAGVRHMDDWEVRELLGIHGRADQYLAGIVFPYRDPCNGRTVGHRVRLDSPLFDGQKDQKYFSEQGCRYLFFAPLSGTELADVSVPVVIVEAEKSALALSALAPRHTLRLLTIATGGVWGWLRKSGIEPQPDGTRQAVSGPSPSLGYVVWENRKTIIAFDSNVDGRGDLERARRELATVLSERGAQVYIATVPPREDVNGPDDLIAVSGDQAALEMLEMSAPFDAAPNENKGETTSESTGIVNAALEAGIELFHDADGTSFVAFKVRSHSETWPLRSRQFRIYLSQLVYKKRNRVANANSMSAALAVLEARALFDGQETKVHTRVAKHEGELWLDLGDRDCQAVRISKEGWSVVDNPPVRFRRSPGMRPLPYPAHGGSITDLWRFLNLRDDADRVLVATWLIATLRPHGPYPILAFHGEHGSAKSTATRVVRAIVDPYAAPIRTLPTDERDLHIAARASHVQAFDNVSKLAQKQSDWLCRLATGGGLATRELYTDADEMIFDVQRPITLNGIEDVGTRGDFADRSIVVYLQKIEKVRPEQEFWSDFFKALPDILGALLDATVAALNRIETVVIDQPPRMADFAYWAVAAEVGLGFREGSFLAAYDQNRVEANDLALDSSLLTEPLKAFMDARDSWTGTNTALLTEIRKRVLDETVRKSREFPKTPRKLSGDLRRLAPNLRRIGIDVRFPKPSGHKKQRLVEITKVADIPSASSAPSAGTDSAGFKDGGEIPGQPSATVRDRPQQSAVSDSKHECADDADGADGLFPNPSPDDDGEVRL